MNDKELILQYLQSHNVMTLATSKSDVPWCSSVYYAVNNDLFLYFVSSNQTRHANHIQANQNASVLIAESNQKISSKKSGIQMLGTVDIVKEGLTGNNDEHLDILELWIDAVGGNQNNELFELTRTRAMLGTIYKFKPKIIQYLNEELFGDYGFRTLRFDDTLT